MKCRSAVAAILIAFLTLESHWQARRSDGPECFASGDRDIHLKGRRGPIPSRRSQTSWGRPDCHETVPQDRVEKQLPGNDPEDRATSSEGHNAFGQDSNSGTALGPTAASPSGRLPDIALVASQVSPLSRRSRVRCPHHRSVRAGSRRAWKLTTLPARVPWSVLHVQGPTWNDRSRTALQPGRHCSSR